MKSLRKSWAIAKKNMRIYYLKGPVLIFGVLFPLFLFCAFVIGRNVPAQNLVPGLIGMALFFTSSATTPAVLPFETRTRTLERLLAAPLTLSVLIGGDVLAAFMFGAGASLVPVLLGFLVLHATLVHPLLLVVAILLSAACFATLGTLFSTPPTDNPSSIMTISNLVRLPLVFVSGVFLPVSNMPSWGQWVSRISPLTYTTELVRHATGDATHISAMVCIVMLAAFGLAFWWISMTLHRRNMSRRLV